MAVEEYNKDNPVDPVNDNPADPVNNDTAENNDSTAHPPSTSTEDVETQESAVEQPFSQDDLPF